MAEEQVSETTIETAPSAPAAPASEAKEPDGTDFVQFEDPKIEARFKRMYANMKQNERALEEMGRINAALLEKVDKIEVGAEKKTQDDSVRPCGRPRRPLTNQVTSRR